jgi:periplasmic protein TonB
MDVAASDRVSSRDHVRWVMCAVVAVAAHGLLVVAVLARSDEVSDAGSPVVMVELAPVASAPSQTRIDAAPAPQVQNYIPPRLAQEVEHKEKPPEEQVEETSARDPEVTLPQRVPDPPKLEQEAKVEQQAQPEVQAGSPQGAPVTAALPASPAHGEVERPTTAVVARWERSLVARLERFKDYPSQAAGARGVVNVGFQIDRRGHVLNDRIVQSSGSSALDEEALATIKRANPLPAPPNGLPDTRLSITIPIRYDGFGQH